MKWGGGGVGVGGGGGGGGGGSGGGGGWCTRGYHGGWVKSLGWGVSHNAFVACCVRWTADSGSNCLCVH